MEGEAAGVVGKVVDAFVAQGFVGVVCVVLMAWIYFREKFLGARINELTDKVITLAEASATANATSAAANNRLADMLSVRRNGE